MKSNLILFDVDYTLGKYVQIYPKLQKIFILSTVEFTNTTVFSDFTDINNNLSKYLDRFTVIVVDNKNTTLINSVVNVLSNTYNIQPKEHNTIKYWITQRGICVVISDIENFETNWDTQFFQSEFRLSSSCTFMQLFGLNKNEVKKLFYEIPNSSSFDIAVYTKDKVSQVSIVAKQELPKPYLEDFLRNVYLQFQNQWFADTQDSLLGKLKEILNIRNLNICVADALTMGRLQEYFCEDMDLVDNNINQIFSITNDYDFQFQLGISQEFCDTHSKYSVDMAYEMSAVMMENNMADIVISLCGELDNCFISIGDSQAIHVYKYTGLENVNVICNQVIFKLLKKLKENQLYFFENSV